jgi:hypothetical protein
MIDLCAGMYVGIYVVMYECMHEGKYMKLNKTHKFFKEIPSTL